MNILIVASEVFPFAKTGGLADVAGALPAALTKMGHNVAVVMPFYHCKMDKKDYKYLTDFAVPMGYGKETCIVRKGNIGTKVNVFMIDSYRYFEREEMYNSPSGDYEDNALRFAFFSRAALELAKHVDFKPDIIHCNDWQTGLIPVYLKNLYREDELYKDIKTVYTIHNLAYQGVFDRVFMPMIDLPWKYFTHEILEFYGNINYMKAGILFSDYITTVSQKYSEEIQTSEYGEKLEGLLKSLSYRLSGIVNGLDYKVWNPEKDKLIYQKYSVKTIDKKITNKLKLQKDQGLPQKEDIPLIGIISRLADQKGFDILAEIIDSIMAMDVQMVILGTGDPRYHVFFETIEKKYKDRFKANLTFNTELSHKIEAASDIFLMPSRYEPCGLNQLYSLKYGTIPVVRNTGGLSDTIENEATGFVFDNYNPIELLEAVKKAVETYKNDKEKWQKMIKNAMTKDFSWDASAKKYETIYNKIKK